MTDRPRRRGDSGGAIGLWVLLMVPVAAFAAVVAMAGPRRLAAESSMEDMAGDLATFAAAQRHAGGVTEGPVPVFPPNCLAALRFEIAQVRAEIADHESRLQLVEDGIVFGNPKFIETQSGFLLLRQLELAELNTKLETTRGWNDACKLMAELMEEDLTEMGFEVHSLRGYYTDGLSTEPVRAGGGQVQLPCLLPSGAMVAEAVQVALAADWNRAGWAGQQVWPSGRTMSAEAVSRILGSPFALEEECDGAVTALDESGDPVWLSQGNSAPIRKLVRRSGRTAIFN